jgi:hypothetical protein
VLFQGARSEKHGKSAVTYKSPSEVSKNTLRVILLENQYFQYYSEPRDYRKALIPLVLKALDLSTS